MKLEITGGQLDGSAEDTNPARGGVFGATERDLTEGLNFLYTKPGVVVQG